MVLQYGCTRDGEIEIIFDYRDAFTRQCVPIVIGGSRPWDHREKGPAETEPVRGRIVRNAWKLELGSGHAAELSYAEFPEQGP